MAKLWEVLKAFEDKKSVQAQRWNGAGNVTLKLDGEELIFYDVRGVPFDYQGIAGSDLTEDWTIVEDLNCKKFRHLFVIIQITDDEEDIFWRTHTKENMSLSEFLEWFQSEEGDVVEVMTAIGVSTSSEATIIVQEGTYQG